MAFRYDTRHLSPQVQQIISKRDDNDKLMKQNRNEPAEEKCVDIYPISIFMRLGRDTDSRLNGVKTLEEYEDFCKIHKAVWFSTDSLATGMSEKRRAEFVKTIKNGSIVEIYFAIGKSGKGNNDIYRVAEVVDIRTDAEGIASPDKSLTPDLWKNDKNKIWIKVMSIRTTNLRTEDFIVQSSKNVLSKSIENSQYHFGYIKRKR